MVWSLQCFYIEGNWIKPSYWDDVFTPVSLLLTLSCVSVSQMLKSSWQWEQPLVIFERSRFLNTGHHNVRVKQTKKKILRGICTTLHDCINFLTSVFQKGQNLEPFIQSFFNSCESPKPKPSRPELTILSPSAENNKKVRQFPPPAHRKAECFVSYHYCWYRTEGWSRSWRKCISCVLREDDVCLLLWLTLMFFSMETVWINEGCVWQETLCVL